MADPISITTALFTLAAALADIWRLGRALGKAPTELLQLEHDFNEALTVIRHALDVLRALDGFRQRDELHELHPVTSDRLFDGVNIYNELRSNIQRLYPAITAALHRIRELAGSPDRNINLLDRLKVPFSLTQLKHSHIDIENRMKGFDRLQQALSSQQLLDLQRMLRRERTPPSPHSSWSPDTPPSLDIQRSRSQVPTRPRSFLATNPKDDQLALIQFINCRSILESDVDRHYLNIIETVIRDCGLDPNFIHDGKYPIHLAVERDDAALLRVLVHNGARISVLDNVPGKGQRETPLRIATRKDSKELAQILLEEGTDPPLTANPTAPTLPTTAIARANAHNGSGQPALWFAAGHGSLPKVFHLLTRLGPPVINHICADPKLPTALWAAAAMNHPTVATTLLTSGADPRIPAEGASTLLHKASWPVFDALYPLLLAHGAAPDARDAQGRTPLHCAARAGHLAACEALLGWEGVDVDARDGKGATPLMFAARAGWLRVVRVLVARYGADVAVRDGEGDDAFAVACGCGRVGAATFLLGRQVRGEDGVLGDRDVDVGNAKGRSALGLAAHGGHVEMVRRLVELGADCGTVSVEDAGAGLDLSKPEFAARADEIRGLLLGTCVGGVGVERREGSTR